MCLRVFFSRPSGVKGSKVGREIDDEGGLTSLRKSSQASLGETCDLFPSRDSKNSGPSWKVHKSFYLLSILIRVQGARPRMLSIFI